MIYFLYRRSLAAMLRGSAVALLASSGDRSIKVVDYETGTHFYSFADTAPAKEGLIGLGGPASIDGLGGAGDYVVSSQAKEHAIVFHKWGKTQPLYKCKTPEAIGPIAATPDGTYVIGGGASGKMYVWEVASGSLIKSWEGHFKAVSSLVASQDGSLLVSGSEDTLVRVWSLAHAIDREAEDMRPLHSWSGHSLPVTGVFRGMGGPNCRVVSVSLDQTAVVYDALTSSGPLHTIRCKQGLTCVAMDAAERRMALGGVGGSVFLVDMDAVSLAKTAGRAAAVMVGAGARALLVGGDAVGADGQGGAASKGPSGDKLHELVGHNKALTSLAFSADGRLLVSTSEDGTMRTWDMESHQCIRRVCMETSGSVLSCALLPRPRSLTAPPSNKVVLMPLQPFKKHRVDAPAPARTGAGAQQQTGAAAPAGDVLLVAGRRRRRVAPSLAEILTASSAEALHSMAKANKASAPSSPKNCAAEAEGEEAEENGTAEPVAPVAPVPPSSGGKGGGKVDKKRKKHEKGGGGGGKKVDPAQTWEEARAQMEAEIEKLKGENSQWKELSNDLWKRLGEGADIDEEGA